MRTALACTQPACSSAATMRSFSDRLGAAGSGAEFGPKTGLTATGATVAVRCVRRDRISEVLQELKTLQSNALLIPTGFSQKLIQVIDWVDLPQTGVKPLALNCDRMRKHVLEDAPHSDQRFDAGSRAHPDPASPSTSYRWGMWLNNGAHGSYLAYRHHSNE